MANDGRRELYEELLPATFRDVPWYVEGSGITGGRKAVARAIINSDDQKVDDLGKQVRNFSVNGYVTARYDKGRGEGKGIGDYKISSTYREQRAALIAAFEAKGLATLNHPIEGEIKNLSVSSYNLTETITGSGIGKISVTFIQDTLQATPQAPAGNPNECKAQFSALKNSAGDSIGTSYRLTAGFVNAYGNAKEMVADTFDRISKIASYAEQASDRISATATAINDAAASVASVITAPLELRDSLVELQAATASAFPTVKASFEALIRGFEDMQTMSFGYDQGTAGGQQAQANLDVVRGVSMLLGLSDAYTAALDLDYESADEIDAALAALDGLYDVMLMDPVMTGELTESLVSARQLFQDVIDVARINARKTITADIAQFTPRTLAYALYGDDELRREMAHLNGANVNEVALSYTVLKGTVRILSQ